MTPTPGSDVEMIISGRMYGGGQRVVADLSDEARRRGDRVRIIFLGTNGSLCDRQYGVTVSYDGRYNRVFSLLRTAFMLRRQLRHDGLSIIHTHGWDADVIGWLAVRRMSILQLVHLHVMPAWLKSRSPKHVLRRFLTRRIFRDRGVRVVAVSDAVRWYWAELLPIGENSVRTIHNGIDLSLYRPEGGTFARTDGSLVIGVAARLVAGKGVEYLLEAVARLVREDQSIRLLIAGEGNHRHDLERHARDLQLSEVVEFLGHVQDMPRFLKSIHVFVCPSLGEGMPITVLEAMAAGVPIIASRVGGIPEAVTDGVEGFLVPPADSEGLASALGRFISDQRLRCTMGVAAANRVQKDFSIEDTYTKVSSLYANMCSEAATVRGTSSH